MADHGKNRIAQPEKELANLQEEYESKLAATQTKLENLKQSAQKMADEAAGKISRSAGAAEETFRTRYGISLAIYLTLLLPQLATLLVILFKL